MTASLQSPLYLKKAKAFTVRSRLELLGKGVGLMVYLIHLSVPLRRISGESQHYIGLGLSRHKPNLVQARAESLILP